MSTTESAKKDDQRVTSQWDLLGEHIAGVEIVEVKNVMTNNGHLTEIYRDDWRFPGAGVAHIIQVMLRPGAINAWHMHEQRHDFVAVNFGMVKLVMYDARPDSTTNGMVNAVNCSPLRPMTIIVPPGVWHGFQNMLTSQISGFVNFSNHPYQYEEPDEWRLPRDTTEIPYRFE